jgi:hypothetical protein
MMRGLDSIVYCNQASKRELATNFMIKWPAKGQRMQRRRVGFCVVEARS